MKEYIEGLLHILATEEEEYNIYHEEKEKYITFYKPLTYTNKLAILQEINLCLKSLQERK
jgi:hypothetical protein